MEVPLGFLDGSLRGAVIQRQMTALGATIQRQTAPGAVIQRQVPVLGAVIQQVGSSRVK